MFKITWDKPANGVRLCETAPDADILSIPPRPVFWEELDLLGLDKRGWHYPHSDAPLLWACERRYFYHGELVLEARGGNIYDAPALVFHNAGDTAATGTGFTLAPVNMERLRSVNAQLLFLLEYEAMEFIHNTWRKYGGLKTTRAAATMNDTLDFEALRREMEKREKKPFAIIKEDCDSFDVMPLDTAESLGKQTLLSTRTEMFIASFSGGKDSQVVLDLVTRAVPPDAFRVIYSDTGYEIPPSLDTWERTKQFYKQRHPSLQFHLSKNHQDVLYYWDKMGSPSRMHRWCCGVMKTAPLYRELKKINGSDKQPHVVAFEGVRSEESARRADYPRIGKAVKHNNVIDARPILHWNSTEIYIYLFERKLPINQGYRNGLSRVGCSICPYSSDWSEHIISRTYRGSIQPFVDKIREKTKLLGDLSEDAKSHYIKTGNWKLRSGGKTSNPGKSRIDIISTKPDLKVALTAAKEKLLTWMSVLGSIHYKNTSNGVSGELKYRNRIFPFFIEIKDDGQVVIFPNTGSEIVFQGHVKRVLYKTTYCVHCEACEVECPTGALSVIPLVSVDTNKCIHCQKCLDFCEKGCVMAASLRISEGNTLNNSGTKTMKTSGLDKYSTFGMKESWVSNFFAKSDTFFEGENGLGVRMVPACLNWFREAEILNKEEKTISKTGKLLADVYSRAGIKVWEIIWINLNQNSKIVDFYIQNIEFNRNYTKEESLELMIVAFQGIARATLGNPLGALCNMFGIKEGASIGSGIRQGIVVAKGNAVQTVSRQAHNTVSLAAIAYSLYRYAEQNGRYNLTVGELYNENQKSGIYRQFGISRDVLETALRTLKEEKNRVLDADLNMGLDNIKLREDLTSVKILELPF